MALDIAFFKQKLEADKKRLENELGTVAHREKGDESWEAMGTLRDDSVDADPNEVADKLEEYETNQAITISLTKELRDVAEALDKIEENKYGFCEIGGEEIEEARLKANPAARTCKMHMN